MDSTNYLRLVILQMQLYTRQSLLQHAMEQAGDNGLPNREVSGQLKLTCIRRINILRGKVNAFIQLIL